MKKQTLKDTIAVIGGGTFAVLLPITLIVLIWVDYSIVRKILLTEIVVIAFAYVIDKSIKIDGNSSC